MPRTTETVRFTGDRNSVYCRERAAVLHRSAQLVVPENYVAFVIADGKRSAPLEGKCGVFGAGVPFESETDTAAVDFVFVSCDGRLGMPWRFETESERGEYVVARGSVEFGVSDPTALADAVLASPDDDMQQRLTKRICFEMSQSVKADGARGNVLSRLKSVVCATAAGEFGLLPTRFDIDSLDIRSGKEIDDGIAPAKFCSQCGAPLVPQARYCPKCGEKIG